MRPTWGSRTRGSKRKVGGGLVALGLVLTTAGGGCAFVFGGKLGAGVQELPRGYSHVDVTVDSFQTTEPQQPILPDDASPASPKWTALASIALACGLVAKFASSPAFADNSLLTPLPEVQNIYEDEDPERLAKEAREELQQALKDKKLLEKEARLKERLAIRKIVEEKKKAEEVVTNNVKRELGLISNEKVITQNVAQEKYKIAREIAIRANQNAEANSDESRRLKFLEIDSLQPAKKLLTQALADKAIADDDAAQRKQFADKAVSQFERAEKTLLEKKAIVEDAVVKMADSATI